MPDLDEIQGPPGSPSAEKSDELLRDLARTPERSLGSEVAADPARPPAPREEGAPPSFLGRRISRYRVVQELGAGGMGQVFKADDLSLDRPVALKILPPELTADPDRVRRFIQEAKAASALNHPHIVAIYEIGEAEIEAEAPAPDGGGVSPRRVHFIAMEYVDGETLRERLRRGLETKRLLEVMAQAADAVAKAHSAGIVHRDLKPENIMVSRDGYAKVVDFGLAKLVDSSTLGAPGSGAHTRTGVLLGTVGYMSPEQARGEALDGRSDLFSLGCILYEAVTRRRPFEGGSAVETLHQVLTAQPPPLSELAPEAPAELQRIVRKCLQKDPEDRYQFMKELAIDLRQLRKELDSDEAISASSLARLSSAGAVPRRRPFARRRLRWTLGVGAVVLAGALVTALLSREGKDPEAPFNPLKSLFNLDLGDLGQITKAAGDIAQRTRAALPPAPERPPVPPPGQMSKTRFTQTGKTSMVALSPDGKYLALVQEDAGRRSLWVRQVAAGGGVQIIGPTQDHFRGLTYSPDGNYLFYVSGKPRSPVRSVYRVPALGGTVTKLVEDVDTPITFAPDGARFAFVRHDPSRAEASLFIANADGTGVTRIFTKKYPDFLYTPAWSPDGRRFACILGIWGRAGSVIEVGVEGGPERPLTEKRWVWATELSWFADGRGLLLVGTDNRSRRSQLWEIDYPSGEARLLTRDNNDYDQASLSGDSQLLAAVQLQFLANLWIAPVSGPGRARPITTGAGRYLSAAWSAEGRIVYSSLESGNWDIWSINLRGADPRQLTSEARANFFPAPTPDGRYLVITSDRGGAPDLWRLNPDGSQPKQLTKKGSAEYPACTPDGRWVVFSSSAPESILWKVSIDGGEAVQLTRGFASHPAVSPDGKLIAAVYREEMGDRPPALALIPISGGAPAKELRLPVTFEAPLRWTRDGRAVSYVVHGEGASNIWSQPIAGGPARQVTDFRRDHIGSFDWSPDGREIVLVRGLVVRDAYLLRGFR